MTEDLLEIDPAASRPRRVAGRLGVWLGLAVMLGLGGLAVWAISDGEPQPGGGDLDDGSTLAVEFGGPYNGFESIGYPVAVAPALDLVDGQVVVVTASQFPPNRPLAVVQCWGDGSGDGGLPNCDAGNYSLANSDDDGNVHTEHVVHRFISTGLGEKDCAAVESGFGCVIAVADIEDYDRSGTAATYFDPTAAGEPAPVIAVSPASGLRDGDVVTVTGFDMVPGDAARITQCVMNVSGIPGCFSSNPTGEIVVGPDGTFEVTVEVHRIVGGIAGPADCVTDPYGCSIVVAGTKIPNPAKLRFEGDTRPTGASYAVAPSGGLVDGMEVTVTLTDLRPGAASYVLEQCVDVAGGAACVVLDAGPAGGDSLSTTAVVRRLLDGGDGSDRDCADPARRCYLRFATEVETIERLPLTFEEVE